MLDEIMGYCRNWFTIPHAAIEDTFTITNGSLSLSILSTNQYFKIEGSKFNDGVYKYPASNLTNETFTGIVYPLAVPKAFLSLVTEIETWQANYGAQVSSPYQSESFGGYSYSKGSAGNSGSVNSWQDAYAKRLSLWRKL